MNSDKIIFHVDVNSAFLSWSAVKKLRDEPGSVDLRTIPSAVGGDVQTRHGVITAKSIPAKKYGITTGEPVVSALKRCPSLVLVPSDFTWYRKCSHQLMELLHTYSDRVQQISIDEAWLDMTDGSEHGNDSRASDDNPHACDVAPRTSGDDLRVYGDEPRASDDDPRTYYKEVARALRQTVRETLGFTVNVGISTNKFLAKMASDFSKPDKTHTLFPDEIQEKMWPLPIGDLYGCGHASAERMKSLGILTIGDAARTDLSLLQSVLGDKAGTYIYQSARGIGSDNVHTEHAKAKSYSNETTTSEDITEANCEAQMPDILKHLSEKVASRMQRDSVRAQTIGIMVKTGQFRRLSRQTTLDASTNNATIIYTTALQLMNQLLLGPSGLFAQGQCLRLIGVSASGLDDGQYQQLSLFDWVQAKENENQQSPENWDTNTNNPGRLFDWDSVTNRHVNSAHGQTGNKSAESELMGNGLAKSDPVERTPVENEPAENKSTDNEYAERGLDKNEPFENKQFQKRQKLEAMMQQIRNRYGQKAISKGGDLLPPDSTFSDKDV